MAITQNFLPDEFFTAAQQQRLGELLARRRAAQEAGREFDSAEKMELESLVDVELDGATRRAAAMIEA